MAGTIFYHNITKQRFNHTDKEDFALSMDINDVIMYTRSGEAILYPIIQHEREEFIKLKTTLEEELNQ